MGRSYALLIGVNAYSRLEAKYQLSGCVADAQLMKSVLQTGFGFEDDDIVELHDAAASASAIRDAMQALVDKSTAGDRVYFHFSGHGSYRRCLDGSEGSGYDSTIMPADSGRPPEAEDLDIEDNEIGDWLEKLSAKTSNITLVFDCCHSGTISRDPFAATPRFGPPNLSPARNTRSAPRRARTRDMDGTSFLPRSEHYVVISGCRDNEKSNEWTQESEGNTLRHGALTFYLSRALLDARPGVTYRDIFEQASQQVTALFNDQHPQIEGHQDRLLFGAETVTPMKYFRVSSVEGDTLTLDGGAAHGLEVGSQWAVYAPGTRQVDGVQPLARFELTSVGPVTATGVLADDNAEIEPGCRCVVEATPSNFPPLSIAVGALEESAGRAMRVLLETSPLLCVADEESAADFRLREQAGGWTAESKEGHPATPFQPMSAEADYQRMLANLETRARARNVVTLNNSASRLKVEFNLYRSANGTDWEDANDEAVFEHGDYVAAEICNNEERDVYLTLLDIGLSGSVSIFYPPGQRSSSELIEPGKVLQIGYKNELQLGLPDDHYRDRGREVFKAIISTSETSFSWLEQGGARSVAAVSQLQTLFEKAGGQGTRELLPKATPSEDWCAINRGFELRRKE